MKRTNAPPIPEGLRIELNGEQEQTWKDVMQVFEDAGWMWINGDKPTDSTNYYKNTLPIIITKSDKKIARGSTIRPDQLTAAQFLQQYQGTIEYEAGDWVVFINDGCFTTNNQKVGDIVQILKSNGKPYHWEYETTKGTISSTYPVNTRIRPDTPKEIESVTKPAPVPAKKPEPYIWDGDVLPEEYWVENPNQATCEIAQYLKMLPRGSHWNGDGGWYKVDPKNVEAHEHKGEDDLPIVPYELWKSILEQPASEAEPVTERMFKKGDRIKVVRGAMKGCVGTIADIGVARSLYYVILDGGDQSWFFSGEEGTGVDIVHHKDEPAVPKWSIVTTDGVTVYEGDSSSWVDKKGTHHLNDRHNLTRITKSHEKSIKAGYLPFSTFEAAEEYISKQKQPAGRKWKVSDKYCMPGDNSGGWYIREHSNKLYKVETEKGLTDWDYTAKEIDEYINSGHWVPDHRSWPKNSKEKNDNTTINQTNNQTTNNDKNNKQSQQDSCISNIENSSSYGSINLRADTETICPGERRTVSAVCLCGQPEYIVR